MPHHHLLFFSHTHQHHIISLQLRNRFKEQEKVSKLEWVDGWIGIWTYVQGVRMAIYLKLCLISFLPALILRQSTINSPCFTDSDYS